MSYFLQSVLMMAIGVIMVFVSGWLFASFISGIMLLVGVVITMVGHFIGCADAYAGGKEDVEDEQ